MPVQTRRQARNARAAGPVAPREYPPIRDIPRDPIDTDFVYAIRRHDLLKLETMTQQRSDLVNNEFLYKEPNASINKAYPLYVAVMENSLPIVKFLINKGANINLGTENGYSTPLYGASKYGYLDIAQYLIEHGADINKTNNIGSTPLYGASSNGQLEIVRLLIAHGADLNKAIVNGKWVPLHAASDRGYLEIVRALIDSGADIDKQSEDGSTSLYLACEKGHLEVARALIDHGADVNKANNDGRVPLYVASLNRHLELARLLIEHRADINKEEKNGFTPLYTASNNGHLEVARLLIEHGADVNKYGKFTPVYQASFKGHLEVVRLLIAHGADVNKTSRDGKWVPLHTASDKGYLEIVRVLINSGADINKQSEDGSTSLYYASSQGHTDVMRLLLEHGADVNKADTRERFIPLRIASENGHLDAVKLLIEHGATITKPIINIAKTAEIKDYLNAKYTESKPKWKGFTKGDLEKFNSIFDTENPLSMKNVSVCPVCLKYVERSEACNYMSHNCSTTGYYHDELYNKYKNASGIINWCTICGRICKGHNHYPLTSPNGPVPEVIIGRDPFAPDCSVDGGGGIEEKIMRFRSMHEYAKRLQLEVGKITHEDAMNELVEAMWMPPRMRLIVKNIIEAKKFNKNNLINFPTHIERNAITVAPRGSFMRPKVVEHGTNMFTLEDDVPVIKFTHKNSAGKLVAHDESQAISKDMLIDFIKGSATTMNRCYVPDCGGYLWPEEIEAAFEMEPIKSSLTDSDRATLAAYKERFYPVYNAAGGQSQNIFQPALNAICAVPVRKRGGRRVTRKKAPRKVRRNKSRHGRRRMCSTKKI